MRALLLYSAILLTVFSSCRKDANDIMDFTDDPSYADPYGTWKLISKENHVTNEVIYKDLNDVQGFCTFIRPCDIVLVFSRVNSDNKIAGHTITNTVSGGFSFERFTRAFAVNGFGGTKVGEPEWSDHIWDNMYLLQSFKVNSQYLRLYFDNGDQSLTFERQ